MRLTFYGAAGGVTGSKHLVTFSSGQVLLDCGMEQGSADRGQPQDRLAFDVHKVSAVIVSHAHLDHIGLLPVLIKQGYRGRVYSTAATRDLSELILLDAAKLQQQDAEYAKRKGWPGAESIVPLYVPDDIPAVMERWEVLPHEHADSRWQAVAPGLEVKLYDAGHILGSAATTLRVDDRRLAYTGDLGRWQAPLLRDPSLIKDEVATLILESTYGVRRHHPVDSVYDRLVEIVRTAIARRGKIIVPAFSLGRTQELVYILHHLTDQGGLPRLPIYVDSPLAGRVTEVFIRHQQEYDGATATDFRLPGENPLAFRNLHYTHSVEESKALNSTPGPLMIISASGMATGGRVMHHLANSLADPKNIILFTGYQAAGTVGRSLVDGARSLHLFGRNVTVRARVETVNDLSAHADADELERYAAAIRGLKNVFLVHGEVDRAAALREYLRQRHPAWEITVPRIGQSFEV